METKDGLVSTKSPQLHNGRVSKPVEVYRWEAIKEGRKFQDTKKEQRRAARKNQKKARKTNR